MMSLLAAEHVHDVLELDPGNDSSVNCLGAFHSDAGQVDRCEACERASRAKDPRRVPVTCGKVTTQLEPDVLPQLAHAFLPGAEIALSHADGSQRQRDESIDKAIRAQRQLERATSDIHDDGTTYPKIKMRERAAKAEAGFVLAAQDSDLETGFRPHELEEILAIGSVAHRARSDDLRALHTKLVGERRHPGECAQRVLNCDFTQRAFLVKARSQSRSRLHFVYYADGSSGRNISNRLANRI